ncbi:MAG: hypothetical protein ACHQZQ_00705 [SAR324 cluster bacterium]
MARDLELPAIPWLVLPAQWEGHPAILAFSRGEAPVPGAAGGPALFLLSARSAALKTVAAWPLPGNSRWLEPLTLAGGETAWLLLGGQDLEIGRVRNGSLTWQRLCSCASLYGVEDPEELGTRLARDLDGDGADEVVLPTAKGLAVYRTRRWGQKDLAPVALEPVTLLLWEAGGKPLQRAPDAAQPKVPELTPSLAGGVVRLLRTTQDGFTALRLPPRVALSSAIPLNAATRAKARAAALPSQVLKALAGVPDGDFKDGGAFVDALARGDADGALAADLPALIVALKGGWPETAPERVALSGLDATALDRGYLLALEDVTGDGIPDLVFGLVRNQSQILRATSELRFYPGTDAAALAFGTPQVLKFSGPAVATVLRTGARERVVLVARTDITLSALLRAIATHEATIETAVYGLGAGGLGTVPLRNAALTFRGFQEGTQVLLVAANLDGTGRTDVLLNLQPDVVSLFASDASGPDLAHAAATLTGPLPREREEIFVGDWQDNGRDSLVFWYRGRKAPPQQRRTLRLVSWEAGQ